MEMKSKMALLLALQTILPLVALVSAASSPPFTNALCSIYNALKSILPVLVIVALAMAAVIFVVGQVLGAEMRAKANSWAQHIVVYTVIGILVLIIIPWLIEQLDPSFNLANACPENLTNSTL